MDLTLYQQQSVKLAKFNGHILDEATQRLKHSNGFTSMEEMGILHSLQVIIENAIGKAKHILKMKGLSVPVSAYDSFELLVLNHCIRKQDLEIWRKVIGLRNAIVHEYMEVNMDIVFDVVEHRHYQFILDFLSKPFSEY